jgi:outer membrane protein
MRRIVLILGLILFAPKLLAETLTLEQAVDRALQHDPRIREQEKLVDVARGLLKEAEDANKSIYDANFFVGLASKKKGNIFEEEQTGELRLRSDVFDLEGLTPWYNLQFSIIKPLYTFGKIENYSQAAGKNIKVKQGDVKLKRGEVALTVYKAYYGYLTARDSRLLLEDVKGRLEKAVELVQGWLKDGNGNAKQSDLFALQTGLALINRYLAEATGLEKIALNGLKVLTGIGMDKKLEVADKRLSPVELPKQSLAQFQKEAKEQRPEFKQLENGLSARRFLVSAKKAESHPNLYAGAVGSIAYTPGRSRLDNPFIYDPFNHGAFTPIVGIKWNWQSGRQPAQVDQAQAELDALVEKKAFAQQGIPYQVAEQYQNMHSYHDMVEELAQASRAGRRWMISSYADFEAGLEEAGKVMTAFQGYVLAHSDYLKAVNDYNMHVAKMKQVIGELN